MWTRVSKKNILTYGDKTPGYILRLSFLVFRGITHKHKHQWEMVNNELKSTHFKTTCQVSESTPIAADWFNKL